MRCLLCWIGLAWASLAGAQEATYLMRGDQLPVPLVANGYVQTVTPNGYGEVLVHVATALGPIGADGSYATVRKECSPRVPEGFLLPEQVQARIRPDASAWAAATQVLEWVADHVLLDSEDRGPQDAVTVLRRRRGRCSGLANATAALLMAAGFEARTVSGLLMGGRRAIPHRWVVCRLPGAGWVPTDPTLGLWAITPRHVAFASAVEWIPKIRVVASSDGGIDELPRQNGRPLRPNDGIELVCRLAGPGRVGRAVAVLYGPAGAEHTAVLNPEGRFGGLLPGRWHLEVQVDGVVLERKYLLLKPGEVNSILVQLPPGPELGS
jgi:hypothetical protein